MIIGKVKYVTDKGIFNVSIKSLLLSIIFVASYINSYGQNVIHNEAYILLNLYSEDVRDINLKAESWGGQTFSFTKHDFSEISGDFCMNTSTIGCQIPEQFIEYAFTSELKLPSESTAPDDDLWRITGGIRFVRDEGTEDSVTATLPAGADISTIAAGAVL